LLSTSLLLLLNLPCVEFSNNLCPAGVNKFLLTSGLLVNFGASPDRSVAVVVRKRGVYARCRAVISFCAFSASFLANFSLSESSARRNGEGVDATFPHVILGGPRSEGFGVETKL